MGIDQSKQKVSQKHFRPKGQMLQTFECTDDLQCQNINSKLSIPGKDPVLVCPSAKCVGGSCACGSECKKDPYMGFCCKDVEVIKSINGQGNESIDTFCIENFSNSTVNGIGGVDSKELFGPF